MVPNELSLYTPTAYVYTPSRHQKGVYNARKFTSCPPPSYGTRSRRGYGYARAHAQARAFLLLRRASFCIAGVSPCATTTCGLAAANCRTRSIFRRLSKYRNSLSCNDLTPWYKTRNSNRSPRHTRRARPRGPSAHGRTQRAARTGVCVPHTGSAHEQAATCTHPARGA